MIWPVAGARLRPSMTWRFDKYSKDRAFQTAQEGAQKARRGLWADCAVGLAERECFGIGVASRGETC